MLEKKKEKIFLPRSKSFWVGIYSASFASLSSFVLAGPKLGLWNSLPGCGPQSGCDAVTNGPLGNIPIGSFLWPVSFIGIAWFVTILVLWNKPGGASRPLLWFIRLGVLGSIGFIIAMAASGHFCKWCAVVHFFNFILWIAAEKHISSNGRGSVVSLVKFIILYFALVSVVLGAAYALKAEHDRKASEKNVAEIISTVADLSTLELLESKHRFGSPDAPVQVVMFTDYQCPDCKRLEALLARIYEQRTDVSLVVKHFPINFDCNDEIGQMKMHPNACWAARAAEAAYILGGEDGWRRMHSWLFENSGSFTDATFPNDLIYLGFDPNSFIKVMGGNETLRIVKEDAADGKALGIWFTPMIFINGVEYLWYYGGQESLARVINSVAISVASGESSPVAPPSAMDKLVEDWRSLPKQLFAEQDRLSWDGSGEVEIVVWGDYQTKTTQELDTIVRGVVGADSRAKYSFRHFPIDTDCNSGASGFKNKYSGSCSMAKLVEAVDILCGSGARWKLHSMFMGDQGDTSLGALARVAASVCKESAQTIISVANSQEVEKIILSDIKAKVSVWGRHSPILVVGGRFVPRWQIGDSDGHKLILQLIEESSK